MESDGDDHSGRPEEAMQETAQRQAATRRLEKPVHSQWGSRSGQ
jgi:hypothetical protein